jgi:hypothetical protein
MTDLESKLPKHKCALSITHNEHKSYYDSIEDYVDEERLQWVSEEEKQKAIAANEIWEIQWYPDTPIGFICVAASSLDVLLEAVALKEIQP